jgi:hypothetical protein
MSSRMPRRFKSTGIVIRASACSDDAPPRSWISSRNCGERHELLCGFDTSLSDRSTFVVRALAD